MRIALVSMHTSPTEIPGSGDAGGMNVVVAEAARALSARGHEVVVATRARADLPAGVTRLAGSGRAAADQDPLSPVVAVLPAGDPELAKGELQGTVEPFAAELRALGRFDAVHGHYWLSALAAQRAWGGGAPVVTTFHTLAAQKNALLAAGDRPEPAVRLNAEAELARSSFVVAGSESELAGVNAFYGRPALGSAVVHPGVDTALFVPRPGGPGSAAPLRVTVLGRVQPLKGQDLAVRAAAELAIADPALFAQTEWVIAGEPTPGAADYAAELRRLAERAGIAARVRFLPAQSREQAAALLASSALVLVPSHSETFGLTALEAGASGAPVIAAGHTGLLEAVPDGVAGVHLSDRDPVAWAGAIADLLRDEPRRAQLAASARRHAELHDWAAHAEALERIYATLAG
ncbi:D-inositol-3-phosphate glycosyltransferase [Mycolicibacterium mucogenicum 261Sha1.1M5]|nr:D-inositol-3-phosphate glycosyltransferase [Mycolicibacterium mucogenicum 261Sha1.1M5]